MVQFSKETENRQKYDSVDTLQLPSSNSIGTYYSCKNMDLRGTMEDFFEINERVSIKIVG